MAVRQGPQPPPICGGTRDLQDMAGPERYSPTGGAVALLVNLKSDAISI